MSEPFDAYLAQLCRALSRGVGDSAAVVDELRDHLEERLAELLARGVPRDVAIQTTIDELGDAATLAAEFNTVTRDLRRRWIMRYASLSVAAAVMLLLVTMAFWPETPTAPLAPRATAQEPASTKETAAAKEKEKVAAKAKASSKEENNAKTERLLAGSRTKAEFVETPLKEFLEYFENLSAVQVYVEGKKLEGFGVTLDSTINLRLSSVRLDMMLELVLRNLELGYYVDDGIVIVTSLEDLLSRTEVRVYNCRDLLELPRLKGRAKTVKPATDPTAAPGGLGPGAAPGGVGPGPGGTPPGAPGPMAPGGGFGGGLGGFAPGFPGGSIDERTGEDVELIDVLRTNINPDSWREQGGVGEVAEYRGMLVVTHTADVHRRIDQLLEMLRQSAREVGATAKP
jgi:hypothetical protein